MGAILGPDGTLDPSPGFIGAVNAQGWRLVSGPDQPPRFAPAHQPARQGGSPQAVGDEDWDGRFAGPPGVNGVVRTVAVAPNGDVYVGGDFAMAINSSGNYFAANHVARWDGSGWSTLGSGVDNSVYALAIGQQGEVYVGGYFTNAGGLAASHVARWNGRVWSPLGSGVNNAVLSMAALGNDLYVGGYFDKAGNVNASGVARWNGATWSALGGGISGAQFSIPSVSAIAVGSRGEIYVAGMFQSAGGVSANNIAKWDGAGWSALGGGVGDPNNYSQVSALALSDSGEVYAGGYISRAGGASVNNLAKWDGHNWSSVGGGASGSVQAIVVRGTDVYAGGNFSSVGNGRSIARIARWNGSQWMALDSGVGGAGFAYVNAIALTAQGELYAGGNFTAAGGADASFVAKWNGDNWSALSGGINGVVYAAALGATGELYVGGDFTGAGGLPANHIARWDGTNWSALIGGVGIGVDGSVNAVAVSGNRVYVGGDFTTAGGVAADHIAQWDGTNWTALGSGVNDNVFALAAGEGGDLYVGGSFTSSGGNTANHIARWDGSGWRPLGNGIQFSDGGGFVRAIAVRGHEVFAGGDFDSANGSPAGYVARWDGTNWSALGGGVSGPVSALAFVNDQLHVGGSFKLAGDLVVNQVARWDGTNWFALGDGISSNYAYVLALAPGSSGELFVGGFFDQAGNLPAYRVARWDGTNWSALANGLGGAYPFAYALATRGTNLYVGGSFDTAGNASASRVAQWDGANWNTLVPGQNTQRDNFPNGTVNAVLVTGGEVYVGGTFTRAGTVNATNLVRWNGLSWSALAGGLTSPLYSSVNALAVSGDYLYVGGSFTRAGSIAANNIARWNVATRVWSALGRGADSTVSAIAAGLDGQIYVGGYFNTAGGVSAHSVARWNPTNSVWSALGSGVSTVNGFYPTSVNAIEAHPNGEIYVGGSFNRAGGMVANGIAKWSNNSWTTLGSGVTGSSFGLSQVIAITVSSDGAVYAGGQFYSAGGIRATNIARWNTNNTWSALGSGLGLTYDSVSALATSGTNLYAGGRFSAAGKLPLANIARWDGASWQTMGSGITGGGYASVAALAAAGADVYAGGEFTTAGGKLSYFFAHWNALGQTGYVPTLEFTSSSNNLVLSWPSAAEGFVIETTGQLSPTTTWTPVTSTPQVAGDQSILTIPLSNRSGFYRLIGAASTAQAAGNLHSVE